MKQRIKHIIFYFALALLSFPLFQQISGLIETKATSGVYIRPDSPEFSAENWFNGKFQSDYEPYHEDRIKLRPFFIRLRNQIVYNLYQEFPSKIILGKNSQILEKTYHQAFIGPSIEPADSIKKRISNMASVLKLLEAKGKTVLTVLAPNKVDVFRESIPNHLDSISKDSTAYQYVIKQFDKYGIDYLDFNKIFRDNRDSYPYPVISNTGIHWSGYGIHVAHAQMIDTLEKRSGLPLVKPDVKTWHLSKEHTSSESDLANLMNLLYPPETELLAKAEYNPRDTSRTKLKALIIGDSFFHNYFAFTELLWRTFDKSSKFWYYNKTEIDLAFRDLPVKDLSAHEVVENVDFIIFVATTFNMDTFPFGFPEKYLKEEVK